MTDLPKLDDRGFQHIVNETKGLIPQYCPEWTDHNLSDPGITLVELFSWMTDSLIYRVNQVPERVYLQLLKLIGVVPAPPRPARVPLTFFLAAASPTDERVVIRSGTEAATRNTEQEDAIVFTTVEDVTIPHGVDVVACESVLSDGATTKHPGLLNPRSRRDDAEPARIFQDLPFPGDAFHVAFKQDITGLVVTLTVNCVRKGAIGIDPTNPPLVWEHSVDGIPWQPCVTVRDTTKGLNEAGDVTIVVFPLVKATANASEGSVIRCRVTHPEGPGSPHYQESPELRWITAAVMGGSAMAEHSSSIKEEQLGFSDGTRDQVLRLKFPPILERIPEEESLEVDGSADRWIEVAEFGNSGADDKHFILGSASGEVRFGPLIRAADGAERPYGAVPQAGAKLRFTRYRTGGGVVGNVGTGTIVFLRSAVPRVAGVNNFVAADGGRDAELLEEMKIRAARALRRREVAVTSADFERLAIEASPGVARAHCIAPQEAKDGSGGGWIRLVLVPPVPETADRTEPPILPDQVLAEVEEYIDQRRVLGVHPTIEVAKFITLRAELSVSANEGVDPAAVAEQIGGRLRSYLHPVRGGDLQRGWPFGSAVTNSKLLAELQRLECVDSVEELSLESLDDDGKTWKKSSRVVLPPGALPWITKVEVKPA